MKINAEIFIDRDGSHVSRAALEARFGTIKRFSMFEEDGDMLVRGEGRQYSQRANLLFRDGGREGVEGDEAGRRGLVGELRTRTAIIGALSEKEERMRPSSKGDGKRDARRGVDEGIGARNLESGSGRRGGRRG